MTDPRTVPDLDQMLTEGKDMFGPCMLVKRAGAERTAKIREKVEAGHRRWAVYHRWLAAQDIEVPAHTIGNHFDAGHDDAR